MRGSRARIKSGCILAVPDLFLGLAMWGYFQMKSMPPVDIEKLDIVSVKTILLMHTLEFLQQRYSVFYP